MNRLLTAVVAAAALWAAACSSGGGSTITPPPPAGNFSLASLKGQYAFVTSGEVFTGGLSATPMSRVGIFTADGQGRISGGVEDVNTAGTPSGAISIMGGNYTVNPDGRGTLTLTFGQTSSISFGIILTSTSTPAIDGLMIDETSNSSQASTGSGNFIKQVAGPLAVSDVAGTYVFDFAGFDGNANPESFIGEFTANSGVISTGLFDDNDNFSPSSGPMTLGTIAQDSLNASTLPNFGRGVATIAGQQFVFYIVDSSRVRFLSTSAGMLSGDAVLQGNSIPASLSTINSSFAFLVAGGSGNGGLTRVGRFTASGSTLSKMLMDVNDAATEIQFNNLSNGSITAYDGTTGRGTLSFQDSNGQTYSFVFYLNSATAGVIQDVSPSNTAGLVRVVADGSILGQSGSPFSSSNISGTYAMNWSGLVVAGGSFPIQDEEDLLAQVKVTNLSLSGTSDLFQFTSATLTPIFDVGTAGQITFNSGNGSGDDGKRVDMDVNLSKTSPIHMVVYIVRPQLAFFANRDNNGAQRIVAGILEAQQ